VERFSTRLNKFLNKKHVRMQFLIMAVLAAVAAQMSLPPSSATLTLGDPLPVPLWKSVLLMDGALTPYRISVILFLSSITLTILAFWGKSLKHTPWNKLKTTRLSAGFHEQEKIYNFSINLGEDQKLIEINLFGSSQLWRTNLISLGLLSLAIIFSVITFFLFRTFSQTNLGLAFWLVSLLILFASERIRAFYRSKPGPFRWRDYSWAGFALFYALLTLIFLSLANFWGMFTWLLSLASLYSWKYISTRPLQPTSAPVPAPSAEETKNNFTEPGSPQASPEPALHAINANDNQLPKTNINQPAAAPNPEQGTTAKLSSLKQKLAVILQFLSTHREQVIFLLILAVGAYFRFGNIFNLAPGFNNDVALLSGVATDFLQGKVAYSPFSSVGWGFETLFLYYIAFWMRIVGTNFLAPRFASASIGFATLFVLYFLARHVAGKRVAWITTALFAASGYHIIFSTLGSRLIFQPFLEALSFFLLWLALEKKNFSAFILTGISLGFTIQAYNASVFYPFLFALFFIYLYIKKRTKEKNFLQTYLPGVIITILAFFITAAPLAGYVSSNWDAYRARSNSLLVVYRMQEMENAQPGTYWYPMVRNALVGSLLFNQRGNSNDLFIEESALDFPITILFVLALAFTIRFWKKPLPFFLLTWFFLGLAAGYVSEPNANRSIGSFIPLYMMCGLFLTAFINFMKERFKKSGGFMSASIITLLIVFVTGAFTYWDYVGPHYKYRWGYAEEATGIGAYVSKLRSLNKPIYITDTYFVTDTVRMISYHFGEDYNTRPYTRLSMNDILAKGFPDQTDVEVVLGGWPEEEQVKETLLKLYPQSQLEIIPKIDVHKEAKPYVGYGLLIPKSNIQSPSALTNGLLSQYYKEWDGQGEMFQQFIDPFIILPVLPLPNLPHFSIIWNGTINLENAGEYGFELRSNNRSQLFVDDQLVVAISEFNPENPEGDQQAQGFTQLTQGAHHVKITYNYEGGNVRLGVLWRIPGADFNWLPAGKFIP